VTQIRAIIIDDLPLAIASLKADLEAYAEVEILGEATNVVSGAKLIKAVKPDVVFLDIHLGEGNGFDVLEIVDHSNIQIIFTTASKDYAIKAFQFKATDYLLKPVDSELLSKAIEKVKEGIDTAQSGTLKERESDTITLNTQEEIRVLTISDIVRLESMGNYTTFYTRNGHKILVTKTMRDFEKVLGDRFLRVHQSHLVHRQHISAYIKTEGGYLKMSDDSEIPVSVRKKSYVIDELKGMSL